MTGTPYRVYGYRGKQVRDSIHSRDLVSAFFQFFQAPRAGEVYNIGGSRFSHCSMLEAISLAERIVGDELAWTYEPTNREGDHIWWISDVGKFRTHYPSWQLTYAIPAIVTEIYEANRGRWARQPGSNQGASR
jgi:CDP-paratose 2-epimerase